jgi:hypothetical protein
MKMTESEITKYVSPEVFQAILSKKQLYIAKLDAGFWHDFCTEKYTFRLTDGNNFMSVSVKGKNYFQNFGDAWFVYGEKLIPSHISNIITIGDAIRYFRKYYTDADVQVCGVVCIELEVLNSI